MTYGAAEVAPIPGTAPVIHQANISDEILEAGKIACRFQTNLWQEVEICIRYVLLPLDILSSVTVVTSLPGARILFVVRFTEDDPLTV